MVNRTFLYWGVFLVSAGAVLLAAQGHVISSDGVAEALRLWPIAAIAIGAAILLRRTRLGVAGGMVAAAMPGLMLGGLVVAAPDVRPDCHVVEPSSYATRTSTFASPARVSIELSCGKVDVSVVPGSGWQIQTGDTGVAEPRIDATGDRLSLRSASRSRPFGIGASDVWRVSLPDSQPADLSAVINAGTSRFALAGAHLTNLDLDVNAGTTQVDLTGATVDGLSMHVNAAAATVHLSGDSDLEADVHANAGKVTLCTPGDLALRVHQVVVLGSTHLADLVRVGDAWQSPGYNTSTHHADVTLAVNVGSVDINPEGGCK